jgi:hypothetical protein
MRNLAVVCVAWVLCACGGSGGGSSKPAPQIIVHELFACNMGEEPILGIEWRIADFPGWWPERLPDSNCHFWTEATRLRRNGFESIGTIANGKWDVRVSYLRYIEDTGELTMRQEIIEDLTADASAQGVMFLMPDRKFEPYYSPAPPRWDVHFINGSQENWDKLLWRPLDSTNKACYEDIGGAPNGATLIAYSQPEGWYEIRFQNDWHGKRIYFVLPPIHIPLETEDRQDSIMRIMIDAEMWANVTEEITGGKICP